MIAAPPENSAPRTGVPLVPGSRYPGLRKFFICIGAQKAGTTWLHEMLSRHPDCHLPPVKEVRFWDARIDRDDRFAFKVADRLQDAARGRLYRAVTRHPRDLPAAVRRFRHVRAFDRMLKSAGTPSGPATYGDFVMMGYRGQPVAGELTPNYSLLDTEDFRQMAEVHHGNCFLFIMRDPVARLWSGVLHKFRKRLKAGTVSDAEVFDRLEFEIADPQAVNAMRSRYDRTIGALEAAVPQQRILYLFYETLFSDQALRKITDFLGIETVSADPAYHVNVSRRPGLKPSADQARRAKAALAPVYEFVHQRFGADVPPTWGHAFTHGERA
ncbi:sulfotransferase family protein [Litoreibacter roseus]|uniref:Sulfotransferase family protein n=1 Tax=Litoreibacter roseus TaxID=2601869 RepID=A0A6N6JI50_9RHOB|nr:sulfotransferase [Litoreibacter roseus]GFE65794.1 hypothetical protein KIN_28680 [Litoreibacter roseus]